MQQTFACEGVNDLLLDALFSLGETLVLGMTGQIGALLCSIRDIPCLQPFWRSTGFVCGMLGYALCGWNLNSATV